MRRRTKTAKSKPVAPGSLVDIAYRELEELIVRLELTPGLALSEAELSQRIGIGRTPIREALHRLAREGLVVIAPRRGIFVTEIRIDAQLRLLEVRRGLERVMATRAARLALPSEREAFAELDAGMRAAASADDDVEFLRLDRLFNQRLAVVSRNEFAAAAIGLSGGLSRRFWYRYYKAMADLPQTARLHADMAGAIARGDPAAADQATNALMDYLETFTRSVFERGG